MPIFHRGRRESHLRGTVLRQTSQRPNSGQDD